MDDTLDRLGQSIRTALPGAVTGHEVKFGELTLTASHVNSLTLTKPLQVFALLSIIYFLICFGISRIVKRLETRVGRQLQPAT